MTFKLVYAVISGRAVKLSSAGCKYHHNLTQRCKNVNISRFFSNHHINTASFYLPQAHFDWLRYSMAHSDDLPLHILTADSQTWNSNNISAFF
jgi:hypothetical protein